MGCKRNIWSLIIFMKNIIEKKSFLKNVYAKYSLLFCLLVPLCFFQFFLHHFCFQKGVSDFSMMHCKRTGSLTFKLIPKASDFIINDLSFNGITLVIILLKTKKPRQALQNTFSLLLITCQKSRICGRVKSE